MPDHKEGERGALVRLLAVYLLWNAAGVLGGSFVYLYFMAAGASMAGLVLSFFFWAGAPILVIRLMDGRKAGMRTLLLAGVAIQAASYFTLAFGPPALITLCAFSFLVGMNCFLFWVPFNAMFFELGRGREALLGSVYFAINPLFGIFLPLIGGAIATAHGLGLVFLIAAVSYAAVVPLAFLALDEREFRFGLGRCLAGLKGFKTLVFLEGVYGGGMAAAMAVIALLYFGTPAELGLYLAVTTLFSVLASFVVSRLSDRSRKRKRYIGIFGSGLGVMSAAMSLAKSALPWSAAVSARNFFSSLFYPFTTAIIMDNKKESLGEAMAGREWLLNYGRLLGIAVVLACTVLLNDIHLSLALLGLAILAYPAVIELKKKHISVE